MLDNKKLLFTGKNKRKIAKEIIDKCKENIDDNLLTLISFQNKSKEKIGEKDTENIFVEKLITVLQINYTDSHPLNEIIIIHYNRFNKQSLI